MARWLILLILMAIADVNYISVPGWIWAIVATISVMMFITTVLSVIKEMER